ncbi:hypothetical protein GGQ88_003521 [Novosphingobium hassiacum]|uniref:Uncharacterized protein n=1 Tax=Novosphingobium hassiacum TaxID=173676 RepID=A0A7W5ZY95_9SPHN|nr:hypothetical protein [Novosphingobium hassiacum]MBB3862223.1 hypothetical protein [Novosphingobium hassiacum]
MTDREWIAEDDDLNREAFRALMNARVDRENALIALLRSEVPIHWAVRRALADALSSKPVTLGSPLAFVGSNSTREKAKAFEKRKSWLQIAASVRATQKIAGTYENALTQAANKHNCSRESARDAVTYANRVNSWAKSVKLDGTIYGLYAQEELIERYINFDAGGETVPPNMTLAEAAERDAKHVVDLLEIFAAYGSDS